MATFWGLLDSGDEVAPLSAPMTLDSWMAAADGDASGFWFQSLLAQLVFPRVQVWGEVAAVARADSNFAGEHFPEPEGADAILGNPGTKFIWAGGGLAGGFPAAPDQDEYDRVRDQRVETLVIGGPLDAATPAEVATRELHASPPERAPGDPAGVRPHVGPLDRADPKASTHLINTFLDEGRVDTSLFKHREIDFEPEVTQPALAKGFAGSMLGFALITVLSLLWMPRRVMKRGRIGARKSVLLRSLFPLVLGFGGWFVVVADPAHGRAQRADRR